MLSQAPACSWACGSHGRNLVWIVLTSQGGALPSAIHLLSFQPFCRASCLDVFILLVEMTEAVRVLSLEWKVLPI